MNHALISNILLTVLLALDVGLVIVVKTSLTRFESRMKRLRSEIALERDRMDRVLSEGPYEVTR